MALFLICLILLGIGIGWGLPETSPRSLPVSWATDELAPSGLLQEIMNSLVKRSGFYNPQYPLFGYLVAAVPAIPYYVSVAGLGSERLQDLPVARVIGLLARGMTVLMAAGTVVIACRTSTVLWGSSWAWIAGLLTMLYPPMYYYGRTSNVDVPALFWTAIGLWQFVVALRTGFTNRTAWILSISAALAMSTKDTSYGALVPVAVILVWREWANNRRLILKSLAIFIATYALASGAVLNPDRYLQHLSFIRHGSTRHFGFHYGSQLPYSEVLLRSVRETADNMGWMVLMLAVLGLVLCWVRQRRWLIWVLPAVGIIIFTILPARFVLYRFTITAGYVLIFFASFALIRIIEWNRTAGLVLTAGVVGWTLLVDADFTWQMWHDSRYEAGVWLARNARSEDRIGHYGVDEGGKLPFTDRRITLVDGPLSLPEPNGPEFLISFPHQNYERDREHKLPQGAFEALLEGRAGYVQMFAVQAPALFHVKPGRFVNPPVRIFVRQDRVAELTDRVPRIGI